MFWHTTRFQIDLSRPCVMGIVNVTPDSFSDAGNDHASALALAERLVAEGADILDIGGESTRPGAQPVALADERARVMPVLRHALTLGVPVSLDTSASELMREALDLGLDIVNDVRALSRPGAADVLASHPCAGICLMHLPDEPATMQRAPHYGDVVAEVAAFLASRAAQLTACGIAPERIVLDPGIGFGKTPAHNWALLQRQAELLRLGYPLLVGWSRKGTLGQLTGRPVGERLAASLAAGLVAIAHGASVLRVHDVAATVDAIAVWRAGQAATLPQS